MDRTIASPGRIALLLALALAPAAQAGEGVIQLNQARALAGGVTGGDTAGFPITLDAPGSYRLTGNLVVPANSDTAILVTAADVSIDLNGFSIRGPGTNGSGRGIDAGSVRGLTVRQGNILGLGDRGINAEGPNALVEFVTAYDNGGRGINVGPRGVVRHCRAMENGAEGIRIGTRGVAVHNNANTNGGNGISAEAAIGAVISGNASLFNGSHGIVGFAAATIAGNVSAHNTGIGVKCLDACTIRSNVVDQNGSDGIEVVFGASVQHNLVRSSGAAGVETNVGGNLVGNVLYQNTGDGVVATGAANRVSLSLNALTNNDTGGNGDNLASFTKLLQNFCSPGGC